MEPLVKIRNLAVSYYTYAGEVQAVRRISFDIPKGKTVALVGESGCGKSVTAKTLLGLIQKPGKVKDGSIVLLKGKELLNNTKKEWNELRGKECSMIFQDALVALNPTKEIGKQIIENLRNHDSGVSRKEAWDNAVRMLEKVGIPDADMCMKKYPHELSGGMRQRVMIAMAMITKPELLIADEPTTALDVTIQAQILELMKELQKETKMAILIITHDMGVVADIADEIVVMYAGKIVEKASCRELFYHPHHPYTWALLNSIPRIDYEEDRSLITIEGSIPDMTRPPKGCGFCARCPYAMKICEEYEPETISLQNEHTVSCWLMHEKADRSGLPYIIGGEINA